MSNEKNSTSITIDDIIKLIFGLILIVFIISILKNDNVEVNQLNYLEFRSNYIGKTENELINEFGTPDTYRPNKKTDIGNIVGQMTYDQSKSYFDEYILKKGKGLMYLNKLKGRQYLTFLLDKNNKVIHVTSDGLDIDGVKEPKVNLGQ